jgi:hypothetical protein
MGDKRNNKKTCLSITKPHKISSQNLVGGILEGYAIWVARQTLLELGIDENDDNDDYATEEIMDKVKETLPRLILNKTLENTYKNLLQNTKNDRPAK